MKPIPKQILIHSAELMTVAQDNWQNETTEVVADLKHIRIEDAKTRTSDKDNRQNALSAVLFFDCHNSRPRGTVFAVDQRIRFGTDLYRIGKIRTIYDNRTVHHYELELE